MSLSSAEPVRTGTTHALQRRTLRTLVAMQAVGAVGITIGFATASLLARDLSGSEKLAGLAQTFQVLGTAIAAWLLARLMNARGRRVGLVAGYLLGATGGILAVLSGVLGSLLVLLVGAVLLGATSAANAAARYAATDLAPTGTEARALALVVWATTLGAVLGPNLTGPAGRLSEALDIPALTGPFAIGALAMSAAALIVGLALRPDPLLHARAVANGRDGGVGQAVAGGPESGGGPHHAVAPLDDDAPAQAPVDVRALIRRTPVLGAAIGAMASAHAVMVSVMVMTPLHMEHGGATLEIIGVVVSVHVLGMFAFSPLVGWAADRFGRPAVLGVGAGLLLLSLMLAGSSPEGTSVRIFAGLFLLGFGWSCATVSASALVTQHAPLAARPQVQGTSDMLMSLAAALAGAVGGVVVGVLGYAALNAFGALLACGAAVAAYVAHRTSPKSVRDTP